MEARLVPLNAFISMCTPHDGWPSPLADAGYSLVGLEIPIREDRTVVLDAVVRRRTANHLLVAEAKSGANLDAEQARTLSAMDARSVVRSGAIELQGQGDPALDACIVGLEQQEERLLRALSEATSVCR